MNAAETERAPASVAAWSLAAKLALDLVGRERLVPRLVPTNGGAEARFAVALALAEDADRVAALVKVLPLAAHAVPGEVDVNRVSGRRRHGRPRATEGWAPAALLRAFLDATADALVRAPPAPAEPIPARGRAAAHVPWGPCPLAA